MLVEVVGVEVNEGRVVVGVIMVNECVVLLEGVIVVVCMVEERKVGRVLIEMLVSEDWVVDENVEVVGFVLKLVRVVVEDRL